MTQYIIKKLAELNGEISRFRVQGYSGTAAANSTTSLDFVIADERWISGGELAVKGGHWGDTFTLKVVDVDNTQGAGAGYVIRTLVDNYPVRDDVQLQINIDMPYVSLIPPGLYYRVVYTNTHATEAAQVGLMMHTHIPTS